MSVVTAIRCWRHGTEVQVKAVGLEAARKVGEHGILVFSIEKCPDCAHEDNDRGYNRCAVEHTPERHEMGG